MDDRWLIRIRSRSGKEDFVVTSGAQADAAMDAVRYLCTKGIRVARLDGPIAWYSFTKLAAN